MRKRAQAFTVAELLFGVGIVAALLTLVMLGQKQLQQSSDEIRCVNHLRLIGQASLQFFLERNGDLFPEWNWYRNKRFLSLLNIEEPHTGTQSNRDTLFTCPGFKKAYPHVFPSSLNRSYSLNYWAHRYQPQAQQSGEENVPLLLPGNLRNIKNQSAMWMFMDGAVSTYVFTYYNRGHQPYMGTPHRNRSANAVFFDGHVAPVYPDDLKQDSKSPFWGNTSE